MSWDIVKQYLPDTICVIVCLVGCICGGVKTDRLKRVVEGLCPSVEPLSKLSLRVDELTIQFEAVRKVTLAMLNKVYPNAPATLWDALNSGGDTK